MLILPSKEPSSSHVRTHPRDPLLAAPNKCHRKQSGPSKYRQRRSGRHRSSIIAKKDAASKAAAADMLRAVTKASEMDADAQYATAVIIRAKSEVATTTKDKVALTTTSTNLFNDVKAIARYINATNAAADALDIKSNRLHQVAVKLKVAEKAALLPTIPAKLAHVEEEILPRPDAIKLVSISKPRNPSAIIDGWRLTHNNSIAGFICGSIIHSDGQFTSSSINSSPSEGSIITTMSGSIYLLGNKAMSIENKSSEYSRNQISKLEKYLHTIRRWEIKFSDFDVHERTQKYKEGLKALAVHAGSPR